MKSSAHGRTFLRFFEEKYQKKKPQGTPGRGGSLRILLAWGIFALEAKMLLPTYTYLKYPPSGLRPDGGYFVEEDSPTFPPHGRLLLQRGF